MSVKWTIGTNIRFRPEGEVYVGCTAVTPWKTLDDIVKVLDVFGVKRKQSPKWNVIANDGSPPPPGTYISTAKYYGPTFDVFRLEYWRGTFPTIEAAAQYAADMNAKETEQCP